MAEVAAKRQEETQCKLQEPEANFISVMSPLSAGITGLFHHTLGGCQRRQKLGFNYH